MNLLMINSANQKTHLVPDQCLEAAYTWSVNCSAVPPH